MSSNKISKTEEAIKSLEIKTKEALCLFCFFSHPASTLKQALCLAV